MITLAPNIPDECLLFWTGEVSIVFHRQGELSTAIFVQEPPSANWDEVKMSFAIHQYMKDPEGYPRWRTLRVFHLPFECFSPDPRLMQSLKASASRRYS